MWWWPSVANAQTFMPPQGTLIAADVDRLYAFLIIVSLISFVLLIGGMIYFVVKYRRRSATDKTAYITHNHTAEFLWSFIPFLIFMFVFAWGWVGYHKMRDFPTEGALEVHVFAKKWDWRFVYKNGKEVTSGLNAENQKVPATLVVPVGRPVKLLMSSERLNPTVVDPHDRAVLHSFFVPAFRIKQDVVPGRYTALWFQAEKTGTYNVFCAEYCGANHSQMRGLIHVVSNEEFEAWLAGETLAKGGGDPAKAENPLVAQGRQLYAAKACIGCHSLDGSTMTGPTFKGLFGRTEKMTDGSTPKADENYIRESILQPGAKTVAGFQAGAMPVFAGQITDEEILALIEFIKTVK